jgi:predicted ABC-type transport system involved in lysophospholipase L1 biosynthesis ATPase subunit
VLVTHDTKLAERCDRSMLLSAGKIVHQPDNAVTLENKL